jgi:hypothetical protein
MTIGTKRFADLYYTMTLRLDPRVGAELEKQARKAKLLRNDYITQLICPGFEKSTRAPKKIARKG